MNVKTFPLNKIIYVLEREWIPIPNSHNRSMDLSVYMMGNGRYIRTQSGRSCFQGFIYQSLKQRFYEHFVLVKVYRNDNIVGFRRRVFFQQNHLSTLQRLPDEGTSIN